MRKVLFYIFFVSLISFVAEAQVGFKVTPTGKHKEWADRFEAAKSKLTKERRRAIKDSLKNLKKINQLAEYKLDSMIKTYDQRQSWKRKAERYAEKGKLGKLNRLKKKVEREKAKYARYLPDSSGLLGDMPEMPNVKELKNARKKAKNKWKQDSSGFFSKMSFTKYWKKEKQRFERLKRNKNKFPYDSSDLDQLPYDSGYLSQTMENYNIPSDSAGFVAWMKEHGTQVFDSSEIKSLEKYRAEYESKVEPYKEYLDQYKNAPLDSAGYWETLATTELNKYGLTGDIGKYQSDYDQSIEEFNNMESQYDPSQYLDSLGIDSAGLRFPNDQLLDHFEGKDKNIDEARKQIEKLKKKYRSLPNSNNPSSGIKKGSMEGTPFLKRFVIGGNVEVVSTDPFKLDFLMNVNYKIRKQWQAGVGVNFRNNFGKSDTLGTADNARGFKVLSNYEVWKGFFGHLEYERLYKKISNTGGDFSGPKWTGTDVLGIGLGRRFRITKKISSTVILLYDVLYSETDGLRSRPFSARIGFEFNQR